jgi:hypothetical protein
MSFLQDKKERLMTYDALRGVMLVAIGGTIFWYANNEVENLIEKCGTVFGIYLVAEGLRRILVNRVKQSIAFDEMKEARSGAKAETIQDTAAAVKEAVVPETAAAVKKAVVPATVEIMRGVVATETAAAVAPAVAEAVKDAVATELGKQ